MRNKHLADDAVSPDAPQMTPEDLAKLYNYPSIGQLFSEPDLSRLDEFCARLTETRGNLERAVRYGRGADADGAMRALRAVEVTLEFLNLLRQKHRDGSGK